MDPPPLELPDLSGQFTIYRIADGVPLRQYAGPDPQIQCRPGEACLPGQWPQASYRITAGTATAQPPVHRRPGFTWNDERGEFLPVPELRAAEEAKARIVELEGQQPRLMRERDLGTMAPQDYHSRIQQINDEIEALRAIVNAAP